MKKIFTFGAFLFALIPASAFAIGPLTIDVSPSSGTSGSATVSVAQQAAGSNCTFFLFDPSGNSISSWTLDGNTPTDTGTNLGYQVHESGTCGTATTTHPLVISDAALGAYNLIYAYSGPTGTAGAHDTYSNVLSYLNANHPPNATASYTLNSSGGGGGGGPAYTMPSMNLSGTSTTSPNTNQVAAIGGLGTTVGSVWDSYWPFVMFPIGLFLAFLLIEQIFLMFDPKSAGDTISGSVWARWTGDADPTQPRRRRRS